jgi:hypothetical protein
MPKLDDPNDRDDRQSTVIALGAQIISMQFSAKLTE